MVQIDNFTVYFFWNDKSEWYSLTAGNKLEKRLYFNKSQRKKIRTLHNKHVDIARYVTPGKFLVDTTVGTSVMHG